MQKTVAVDGVYSSINRICFNRSRVSLIDAGSPIKAKGSANDVPVDAEAFY